MLFMLIKRKIEPTLGFLKYGYSNASGFTGGYSYSSPSDLAIEKTLKGFNLNNRGS
jgi:hypothetical protein